MHKPQDESNLVSVVIPAYNSDRFLGSAIQSVLDQTYSNYEVIVVDDGSEDQTREIVASFGDKVRYIYQENKGLAGARNTGILAAKGEFIGLLDADDQWLPNFLETMLSLVNQHPGGGVYYCCARFMDVDGNDLTKAYSGPIIPPESTYLALLRGNFINACTILMRRSIVLSKGLFDPSLRSCEDWDLWLRLSPDVKFIGSPAYLVRYRIHGGSLSTNVAGMHQAARSVIEKHFGSEADPMRTWTAEKRRAYGGLYRYQLLTTIQRIRDWEDVPSLLSKALQIDPTLSEDLDLFYELALGSQPPGYRGSAYSLELETNSSRVQNILESVFSTYLHSKSEALRQKTYAVAFYGLGLVAYNYAGYSLSRSFFLKAIKYHPRLLFGYKFTTSFLKSFMGGSLLKRLKQIRSQMRFLSGQGSN